MEAAPDVAELLSRSPAPTILVTSRQALRIRGEHEVAIPTLDVPSNSAVEDVLASPATTLFVKRAREVLPSIAIDESTVGTIVDICRPLSGLHWPSSSPLRA
jgi:predicted ATPase